LSLKAVFAAVALAILVSVSLAAGTIGQEPDNSLFQLPLLPGFETLPLSPVLFAESTFLYLLPSPESEPTPVASADWTLPSEPPPPPEPVRETTTSGSNLQLVLGAITALLALGLLALIVAFLTMRQPAGEQGTAVRR
jgi:hypothetical protein